MTKAFDAAIESIRKSLPQESEDGIQFLKNLSEMGQKAAANKEGVGDDKICLITRAIVFSVAAHNAAPNPLNPGVMVATLDDKTMLSIVYTALLVGVGLGINEEIR